jgi:DNA repair protein RecO (recombination protein O)
MPLITDVAVVLRQLDYSETSQIAVLLLRRHGKVRAIAKGIRRNTKTRFSPGIDLLDLGNVKITSRPDRSQNLATLTEFKHMLAFTGLRESLPRLHGATYVAEITAALTEDFDPHPRVYDALILCLKTLSACANPLASVARFQKAILLDIGSMPRFDECVRCHEHQDLTHFSSIGGGTICRQCAEKQAERKPMSAESLQALQSDQWPEIPTGIFRLFNYHIAHLIGHEPKLKQQLLATLPSEPRP